MFINRGGLHEQHRTHGSGKLDLQPQRHHHGHRHLQQFGQLHHLHHRGRCLAASRHLLLTDPRHHGSLSPAALLLKPRTSTCPPSLLCLLLLLLLLILLQLPHPVQPHSSPPSLHRDHETNMDGLDNLLFCPP